MDHLNNKGKIKPKIKALLSVIALSISGTACSLDIEKARNISIIGDGFDQSLAREYQELAIYEADEMYDWPDAVLFSRKAIMASDGQSPVPEQIHDWNLPDGTLTEFSDARLLLTDSLDSGFREEIPIQAAKAQASFDCWVEQQEEGWQLAHITKCKQNFKNAMGHWAEQTGQDDTYQSNVYTPVYTADIGSSVSTHNHDTGHCRPVDPDDISTSKEFRIQFQHNSAKLGPAADDTLIEAAIHAREAEVAEVFAEGHADLSGTNKYNLNLSLNRTLTVWQRLISLGVPVEKLWLGPRGETQPLSNAENDSPNALDRRVLVKFIDQNTSELVNTSDCTNSHVKASENIRVSNWNGQPSE